MELPSSSESLPQVWEYDVFISFRGEDTRKTYVDHLYSELVNRQIHVYKDDITLPRGDSIGPSLMRAIEESRIAVIIFSKNYAASSWCLEELTHIMKCRAERGQLVIPIFYGGVDPSDVRSQKRKFGEAFKEQEKKNSAKAESWRKAIVDASNIAGWDTNIIANGHESDGIKLIADAISDQLLPVNSSVDKALVGMESRLKLLKSQLKIESPGVHMVGIWGVGGGGKTTLAQCVYDEISHFFGGHYFVDNIREASSSKNGLKNLQQMVLKSLLKKEVEVESVEDGKRKIKQRLCHSNVLIVLDDVDHIDQLRALAGSRDWFGDGSRVIITTRDEHLLKTHRIDEVSPVSLLSCDEAVKLFRKYAYRENEPIEDYDELSLRVVSYSDGLPLALKILGSFLYDKDNIEWLSALDKLKANPNMEIVQILKISYDGLEPLYQELFLDIACFFRGRNVEKTKKILEACEFYPDIGIRVLIQKALITISKDDMDEDIFDMHDLVEEMGHYIIQGAHRDSPEEHSRLWQAQIIDDMCLRDEIKPNDKVKAIRYDHASSRFPELVSNMKKLKLLVVDNYYEYCPFLEGPSFLSNELRCLHWPYYPASLFPENFHPTKLAYLKLDYSLLKELWKDYKFRRNSPIARKS